MCLVENIWDDSYRMVIGLWPWDVPQWLLGQFCASFAIVLSIFCACCTFLFWATGHISRLESKKHCLSWRSSLYSPHCGCLERYGAPIHIRRFCIRRFPSKFHDIDIFDTLYHNIFKYNSRNRFYKWKSHTGSRKDYSSRSRSYNYSGYTLCSSSSPPSQRRRCEASWL